MFRVLPKIRGNWKIVQHARAYSQGNQIHGAIETDCGSTKELDTSLDASLTPLKVIESLPTHRQELDSTTILNTFAQFAKMKPMNGDAMDHPNFLMLRRATINSLPTLRSKDIRTILVGILNAEIPADDKLCRATVHALLLRSAFITINDVTFLDFLMRERFNLNHLPKNLETLRLTLQTLFLIKITDELGDFGNFNKFMDIARYAFNNSSIISASTLNALTTSLLLADDNSFETNNLITVIVGLAKFGVLSEHVAKLLKKMYRLWCQSEQKVDEVVCLLKVLAMRKESFDYKLFNDAEFIQHCAQTVIKSNDKNASFYVLDQLNKLNFGSTELIDHLSSFFDSPEDLEQVSVPDWVNLCIACEKTHHTPSNWSTHILPALQATKFEKYLGNRNIDWLQFALTLNSLGFRNDNLIQRVTSTRYIESLPSFDHEVYKELKTISKSERSADDANDSISQIRPSGSKSLLYQDLENLVGPQKLWPNFAVNQHFTIPFVLKMDLNSGEFVDLMTAPSLQSMKSHELLIGISVINNENPRNSLRKWNRLLEQEFKIPCLRFDESRWETSLAYERSFVFYFKIMGLMEKYRYQRDKKKQHF